jgi:hypothetical protein
MLQDLNPKTAHNSSFVLPSLRVLSILYASPLHQLLLVLDMAYYLRTAQINCLANHSKPQSRRLLRLSKHLHLPPFYYWVLGNSWGRVGWFKVPLDMLNRVQIRRVRRPANQRHTHAHKPLPNYISSAVPVPREGVPSLCVPSLWVSASTRLYFISL